MQIKMELNLYASIRSLIMIEFSFETNNDLDLYTIISSVDSYDIFHVRKPYVYYIIYSTLLLLLLICSTPNCYFLLLRHSMYFTSRQRTT